MGELLESLGDLFGGLFSGAAKGLSGLISALAPLIQRLAIRAGYPIGVGQAEFIAVLILVLGFYLFQHFLFVQLRSGRPMTIALHTSETPQQVVAADIRNGCVRPLIVIIVIGGLVFVVLNS